MVSRSTFLLLTFGSFLLAGCGGGGVVPPDTAGKKMPVRASNTSRDDEGEPEPSQEKSVDPDDVWFENPLQIASNRQPLAGVGPANANPGESSPVRKPDEPKPEPKPETESSAAAAGGWETVISNEAIEAEIKKARLELNDSLSSVSKYNGNYKEKIQMDAAVLAALAAIVPSHPVNPSWEADAKFVRDLSADIQAKAKGLGNESYEPTLKAWEPIEGLLSGNKPGGLPESAESTPFSEVVKRGPAMKRMQTAYDHLKSNVATADILKKEAERALQEIGVLAMLNRVIGTEGYDLADEEEYKAFVQAMEKACQEAAAAVKAEDFAAFSDALSRMNKTCGDCHGSYRFGT